jgi:hypothetical protein
MTQQAPPPMPNPKSGMSGKTKGCLGCLGIGIIGFIGLLIVGMIANNQLKDDFTENKATIIADMTAAIESGDHARAVEIGKQYESVGDYEFNEVFGAAKKVVDAANAEKRASQQVAEAERKSAADAAAVAAAAPASIGESFRLGDFSYTITSVRKTNHIGGSDFESALVDAFAQGLQKELGEEPSNDSAVFLIVRYRIKNEGTEAAVVSTTDFTIVDAKGRKFTTSSDATSELVMNQGADFLLSELQPGIGSDGVQAFQLPNDSFDGELILVVPEKGFLSSGEKRVKLK